jgi:glycosyltransferase involved in cell wall biosynthesis
MRIDIIQTSSFMAPGFALRKNEIIPMVTRISSYSPLCRSTFGRGNKLSYKLLDWMEKKCVIDADATFSPSEFMIDVYSSNMGFKPKLIRTPTLYNKIKEDYSTYNNFLQKKKYLLYFGQLSRIKGVDLFIDIIPKILNQFNDIFFVIVGRDDGLPNGKSLVHCISESSKNYSKRIIIRPSLNKSQLYPIIKNSFGVIMPSRVDNYPNACLEAQSFGIPVVGTYGSSLDEMIIDEETGYLARNGDVNSLYEAIIKLLTLNKKEMNHMKARIINLRKERSSVFFDLLDYYKNIKRIVE